MGATFILLFIFMLNIISLAVVDFCLLLLYPEYGITLIL